MTLESNDSDQCQIMVIYSVYGMFLCLANGCSSVSGQQGFIQDQIIASHMFWFASHMFWWTR